MSVDDELRLAWQAHRDGKIGRRDALLTLAAKAIVQKRVDRSRKAAGGAADGPGAPTAADGA